MDDTQTVLAALDVRLINNQRCGPLTADSCATATRSEARVTSPEPSLHVWVATPEGTALHKRADKGISSPPFVTD